MNIGHIFINNQFINIQRLEFPEIANSGMIPIKIDVYVEGYVDIGYEMSYIMWESNIGVCDGQVVLTEQVYSNNKYRWWLTKLSFTIVSELRQFSYQELINQAQDPKCPEDILTLVMFLHRCREVDKHEITELANLV